MESILNNFMGRHLLTVLILLPIIGSVVIFSRSAWDAVATRRFALGISIATLIVAAIALAAFLDQSSMWRTGGYCLVEQSDWIMGGEAAGDSAIRIQYKLGVDGVSMPLLLLTAMLTPLAIWSSFTGIQTRQREYYALMLLLHGAMLGVFCARDLLLFYVFFEFTLIPLFFLIGIWGGKERAKAANMFFIYTLAGSLLTFAGVLYLGWKAAWIAGDTGLPTALTFDLDVLYQLAPHLTDREQFWLFIAFFAGFAIKVPLFPFHTWLPLAHVEAPTAGSVMLAAVLLKLGTYGFLRLSLPMLPAASIELAPYVGTLAVIGIIYGALAAWVQSDVKKLVAYSSVSHLGFCLLGMFCLKTAGLTGSLLYMVNHGLSTGALFLIVGMIYERYHTREMSEMGGLARKMPIMTFFLIVFTMSSIGLPGLNGFVSEFLVLLGVFTSADPKPDGPGPLGVWFAVPAASGILLGAIYMLHMVRRVLFGPLKEPHGGPDTSTGLTPDLTRREIGILTPIAIACIVIGVYPKSLTDMMVPSLDYAVLNRVLPPDWSSRVVSADIGGSASAEPRAESGSIGVASGEAGPKAASDSGSIVPRVVAIESASVLPADPGGR
ncbi:MAG: NADH-quinone oxidoreductase subunit M [Phycisphaerae bacterium]|nr:NADH-quinone oxidoreductase subunit M [Phycisphaerae bacterium]